MKDEHEGLAEKGELLAAPRLLARPGVVMSANVARALVHASITKVTLLSRGTACTLIAAFTPCEKDVLALMM